MEGYCRIKVWILGLFSFFISISSAVDVYVKWDTVSNNFQISEKRLSDPVAWATFGDEIAKTGWSYLEVYTNGAYDDSKQAYAAGLAEGYITQDLITKHWYNTYKGFCTKPLNANCKKLQAFIDKNLKWMASKIATEAHKDSYWHQVQLFLEQQAGLLDGYSGQPQFPSNYSMDVTGIALLQLSGDIEDLQTALGIASANHVIGSGSCSALIKVLPGNEDLYVAQDTWSGLNTMLRTLKKYDFQFHKTAGGSDIPGQMMTFSSYPGILLSGDDFYVLNTGLVSIETTIGNSNPDLWQYVTAQGTVFEAIRALVANRLATTAEQWTDIFSQFNSGTYNNEWMVVDYKVFKPGAPLPTKGLLYVLDQIPGMIVAEDLSQVLAKERYFASYNSPYFPEIFNASGCWNNVKKYGDWFTHEHTPRANIFRRDQVKVKDIESMTRLMRYNDFTHDPLARCNCTPPYSGENAISARSDLNPKNGSYPFAALGHRQHAGIDMKLTSFGLAPSLEFVAISSPAYDDVPVFQWSKSSFRDTVNHVGHPDLWNFKPVIHKWGSRNTA